MISYNPKEWFTFIFRIHKSDTVRQLAPMLVAMVVYAWVVAWLEMDYWHISEDTHLRNLTIVHSLLGFVISLLLVFRTNTAYDRWWEGRKLWGALVNNSRNLALKLNAILPADAAERHFFKRSIGLYASVLAVHLQSEATRLALDEKEHPELENLDKNKHLPNQVAAMIFARVNTLYQEGVIKEAQFIILGPELQSFTDVCGACERIKNTPIPFSYNVFIKKFIFFYVMSMPIGFVFSLGHWVIPVVVFVFYVLASLELLAEEIEDPFDGDTNDLPTMKIAANIKKHVAELL